MLRMNLCPRFLSIIAVLVLVLTGSAQAAQSLSLKWVNSKGGKLKAIEAFPKVKKMSWVWSKSATGDMEEPALRLEVTSMLPSDWKMSKATGNGAEVVEPFSGADEQTATIDVRSAKASVKFVFDGKGNKKSNATLAIDVDVSRPYVRTQSGCDKDNFKLKVNKADASYLYVGFSCVDHGDSYDLYFFRSADSKWMKGHAGVSAKSKARYIKHTVSKSSLSGETTVLTVGVTDMKKNATEFSIVAEVEKPTDKKLVHQEVVKGVKKKWKFALLNAEIYMNGSFVFRGGKSGQSYGPGFNYTPHVIMSDKFAIKAGAGVFIMHGADRKNYPVALGQLALQYRGLKPLAFEVGGGANISFQKSTAVTRPVVHSGFEYHLANPLFGFVDRALLNMDYVFATRGILIANVGFGVNF